MRCMPYGCDVVEAIQPRALAFNGKKTANLFYRGGTHRLNYGRQSESIGAATCYVLPSTAATSPTGLLSHGGSWPENFV